MSIRETIARMIAPNLQSVDQVKALVQEEVQRAKMSLPATANYDPKGEGYRPMGGNSGRLVDLQALDLQRMRDVAYWMWDHSPMVKGMASMDKSFLFAEPVSVSSDDENVQEILDATFADPCNDLVLDFPELMMWLSLLGEQCWPVTVYPQNGRIQLDYAAPDSIKDVYVLPSNRKIIVQVELFGNDGRSGRKMAVIRKDFDPRSKTYDRLVGDCFFWRINNPPDSPRGRSDFLTLFDWIDGLERSGYNHMERAEHILNFVWDVTLKGMNGDQIRDWLRENPPPQPGSIRAHNENVEWDAVSPELKASDANTSFDMGKGFIMGAARRPASWFGEGGKAYQTEAEQFGQVPIKDLDKRQQLHRKIVESMSQFAIDQAVIAKRLSAEKAEAGFTVSMPEISKKDFSKLINGVPQVATALTIAEQQAWVSKETATQIFSLVMGQLGIEVDVQAELDAAKKRVDEGGNVTKDYQGVEAIVQEVVERMKRATKDTKEHEEN